MHVFSTVPTVITLPHIKKKIDQTISNSDIRRRRIHLILSVFLLLFLINLLNLSRLGTILY